MSRTYLLLASDLLSASIEQKLPQKDKSRLIAGYFTICLTSLVVDKPTISTKARNRIRRHHFPRDGSIGCFVIGELCRSSVYSKIDLPGEKVLDECLDVIMDAQDIIGGRLVLVESRKAVLESLYAPAGFVEFESASNETIDGETLITSLLKIY